MNNQNTEYGAFLALARTFVLGFKFLAWLNGLGVLLVLSCSIGLVEFGLAPQWLRLPLAAFLAGLALCALGLLWSYPAQSSLLDQVSSGRLVRRMHWLPLFCTILAYSLSLIAFALGCWFTQTLASFTYLE